MLNMARLTSTDEDFGKDHGLIHEVVVTGRKVGAGHGFWSKLAHDESLFKKVVTLVDCNGYQASTSQKLAREIMGYNMFGVEEAIQYLGVKPSGQQLAALAEVPLTEANLREAKDTHICVAVFPMSILDIRDTMERRLFYSHKDAWYNKQAFAKDRGRAGWQLVRKTPIENSTNKGWDDQQTLLSDKEETPTARIMVYTIIGHFLATGERLFEHIYVRCSDLDSDGRRVCVGNFGETGLDIFNGWGGRCYGDLGVAASLKFQTEN